MIIRQEDRVPEEGFVSKSQKKREMDALQGLGKELVELPADSEAANTSANWALACL